jgi:hypothetical protein
MIPCRCAVNGEPFAIQFERMSPAHRFQIARIERTETTVNEHATSGSVFGRQPAQQSYDAGEFDWTGCACPHCGNRAGVVYCNGCGKNRVRRPGPAPCRMEQGSRPPMAAAPRGDRIRQHVVAELGAAPRSVLRERLRHPREKRCQMRSALLRPSTNKEARESWQMNALSSPHGP